MTRLILAAPFLVVACAAPAPAPDPQEPLPFIPGYGANGALTTPEMRALGSRETLEGKVEPFAPAAMIGTPEPLEPGMPAPLVAPAPAIDWGPDDADRDEGRVVERPAADEDEEIETPPEKPDERDRDKKDERDRDKKGDHDGKGDRDGRGDRDHGGKPDDRAYGDHDRDDDDAGKGDGGEPSGEGDAGEHGKKHG